MRNRPQPEFLEFVESLFDVMPVGIVVIDDQNTVIWANRFWNAIQERIGGRVSRIEVGDDYLANVAGALTIRSTPLSQIATAIRDVRDNDQPVATIECQVLADDGPRWLEITTQLLDVDDRQLIAVLHQEITERKERERSLEWFREAVDHAPEPMIIGDGDGRIEYANRAFVGWSGLTVEEVRGESIWLHAGDDRDPGMESAVWDALRAGKPWREDLRYRSLEGELRWQSLTVAPIRDEAGGISRLISIVRDITERRKFIEELTQRAYYDSLTGLPNRTLFLDRLSHAHTRAQRSNQPLAVMFLDLNGFKRLNDRFGHQTGDVVLAEIARRLSTCLRTSDTVARSGGDEFNFLLEEIATQDDAIAVARRVVREIQRPLPIDDKSVTVSASIGIAFDTSAVVDPELLLQRADIALYHAKARREDRCVVYQEHMTMPNRDRV